MRGLNPNTEYTVYLSNEYQLTPVWSVEGEWNINFLLGTSQYIHDAVLTQDDSGALTGTGFSASDHPWTATGQVTGTQYLLQSFTQIPQLTLSQ